jgi:hypothetical protein
MTVVALWPATAHAALGWWGWLEELSGPGFFDGPMGSIEVKCWQGRDRRECRPFSRQDPNKQRNERFDRYLQITFGGLTSRSRPRFKDLVALGRDTPDNHLPVRVFPLSVEYMFRPHPSIDIGPGAGVLLLTGTHVDAHARLVLIPVTACWKFLLTADSPAPSKLRRAIGLSFQTVYITKGFSGRDFGDGVTTFRSKPELRALAGISIDITELR